MPAKGKTGLASRRNSHSASALYRHLDDQLRVSTHKSLIKTLGRQYTDASQFFLELVVNSWMWGDATRVEIRVPEDRDQVEYEEWGRGMDLEGVAEFLTKGKTTESGLSQKYKRPIRESYGLGSLGWLSLGRELEIQGHKGRFDRTILLTEKLIDRYWDTTDQATWRPIRVIKAPMNHDGLRLTIRSLTKKIGPVEVRGALLAKANFLNLRGYGPFEVYINGEIVRPENLRGATLIPVSLLTQYGRITGEILILPVSKSRSGIAGAGIHVQQKHVTILQNQFFGLDQVRLHGLGRVSGWVNADFLRRLPSGNEFERDTSQWRVFEKALRVFMKGRVYKFLRQSASNRELSTIRFLNREIAERLRRSLRRNLNIVVKHLTARKKHSVKANSKHRAKTQTVGNDSLEKKSLNNVRKPTRSLVKLGDQMLAFDIAHGGDRGQAYVETDKNGVRTIYVNMDHPMWDVEGKISPTKLRYCIRQILERSIAEEIIPTTPSTPEEAFTVLDALYNDALA